MLKALIVLHRYVGVAVGVLMTLWCLSGFVMMYQSFPELSPAERLRGLAPLAAYDLGRLPVAADAEVTEARLEMAAGALVLRLSVKGEKPILFDLAAGARKTGFSEAETLAVAQAFAAGQGISGAARPLGVIATDQWTVGLGRRNAPIHKFALDDPAATLVYVSGATGEAFQDVNRRERVLAWLGAIPHWLYPTILRSNPPVWTQVVIWGSTIGVFLTVTGVILGVLRLGKGRGGAVSPYKGLWFWHHMTGLVFGALTLTWVFSGLLTMNPWGLLGGGSVDARGQLAGSAPWSDIRAALQKAPLGPFVQLAAAPFGGEVRVLAVRADGAVSRLGPNGVALPLTQEELAAAFSRARFNLESLTKIDRDDAYYYGHHGEVALPAWRAVLSGEDPVRVYVDAGSGRVLRVVDADARGARWLSSALHDFDWPVIRRRPIWDLVVLPLLAGVTILCGIGAWLGFQRIGVDVGAARVALRRRKRPRAAV